MTTKRSNMHVLGTKNGNMPCKVNNLPRGISKEGENNIFSNSEQFKKLQEQMNFAFEVEHRNEDMISKIKKDKIAHTISSILEIEEKNDNVIKKIILSEIK